MRTGCLPALVSVSGILEQHLGQGQILHMNKETFIGLYTYDLFTADISVDNAELK